MPTARIPTETPQLSNPAGVSICLGMIVKDEAHIIERCLDSVKDAIDLALIFDTGSTDGTVHKFLGWGNFNRKEVIFRNRPWVNFGHNRSEVLEEIRNNEYILPCDYTLMLDADETLEGDLKIAIAESRLEHGHFYDTYQIEVKLGDVSYRRNFLFSNSKPFYFEGVVHEYPECNVPFTTGFLEGVVIRSHHDGARSKDPMKFKKDVEAFKESFRGDITPREAFYFAQSLRDAGDTAGAATWYERRTSLGGYEEEVFYSHLMVGRLADDLDSFVKAHEMRPNRAEPLFYMAKYHMKHKQWNIASLYLDAIDWGDEEPTGLFIETDIRSWRARMEMAVAEHYAGRYSSAWCNNSNLLYGGALPRHAIEQVEKNLEFSKKALEDAE